MKRNIIALIFAASLCLAVSACGSSSADVAADSEKASEGESTEAMAETDTAADAADTADTADTADAVADTADFSFEDISDQQFVFASGVGAWQTLLNVSSDGSFTGYYSDSDMGDTGDGYDGGTVYECDFNGQFTSPVKVDDYTYQVTISSYSQQKETGSEEIIDNIRYVYSDPYGIDNADTINIYLPGKPVDELSEDEVSWLTMSFPDGDEETNLPFYVISNVAQGEAFSSYEIGEVDTAETDDDPYGINDVVNASYADMDEELAAIQAVSDNIDAALSEDISQLDMNFDASYKYQLWDGELNSIWSRLKSTLDADTMEKLTEEERSWIDDKEKQVEEAGAEYEGGSLQPMVEDEKAADLTRERVLVLAEYLK